MSTCISHHGEYSDHEPGDWCPRCGAFNEQAIVAERDQLRAKVRDLEAEVDHGHASRLVNPQKLGALDTADTSAVRESLSPDAEAERVDLVGALRVAIEAARARRQGQLTGEHRGQDMLSRTPARPEPEGRRGPVVIEDVNDGS